MKVGIANEIIVDEFGNGIMDDIIVDIAWFVSCTLLLIKKWCGSPNSMQSTSFQFLLTNQCRQPHDSMLA